MDEKIIKISDSLLSKNSTERASIKSTEIAKLNCSGEYIKDDIKIEIIGEIKKIESKGQAGVEVFAKGWKNGKPLGFGKDGSVEIERFRIFNPPILVEDPKGDIVRKYQLPTGEEIQRVLREDPIEAIRSSISHTAKIVGKENTKIIKGKIGNTTSTFYPQAGSGGGNSSVDGYVLNSGSTYSTVRGAASGSAVSNDGGILTWSNYKSGATYGVERAIIVFDTSALGDGDTIDSATLSLYGPASVNNVDSDSMSIVGATPASDNVLVVGDYSQIGTTKFASDIAFASLSLGGYNDFSLNASGLSNISKTGASKFGGRTAKEIAGTAPTGLNTCYPLSADTVGTDNDPKLVVVHSGVGPAKLKTLNFLVTAKIKTIDSLAIAKVKTIDSLA
jgi:hypothetical protein